MTYSGVSADHDFEPWYRDTWPRLIRALVAQGIPTTEAEEAVAEACARALQRWSSVSAMAAPDAWTYRVAQNVIRRRARRMSLERRLSSALRIGATAPPEATHPLWRYVSMLPPREREVLVLRYVCDLTQRAIADWLNIAPGTVAATLAHARRHLIEAGLLQEEDAGV